jgi:hypothetical protein
LARDRGGEGTQGKFKTRTCEKKDTTLLVVCAGEQQGEKEEGGVFEEFKQKLEEKGYKLQMGAKLSIHSEESIKFMTQKRGVGELQEKLLV